MSKNFFIYFILSFISVLPLQNLAQQELNPEQIYEKVNDAVVIVLAYDSDGELRNQGSGVVMSSEGYIFTNYHLMKNASSVMVVHGDMSINEVEIIGGNIEADVLALRIPKGNFSFIELPESDEIRIGQRVYAIGSPMGYENTISEGIISGYRKFDKGPNLIQITASISPGSSGGAVVNSRGELIGISTYTVAEGQNINFAIPIKDIMEVEIKPFVISEDEINEETVEVEEHETFKYPDYKIEFNYDPKAIEHLKKGKELIRKSHTQDDKKNEVICLKQAIESFNKAIKVDSSIVEAYYLIGEVYSNWFYLDDEKSAQKYYDEVLSLIQDIDGEIFDSISVREVLVEIGNFYRFSESESKVNKLKAANIYESALKKSLPKTIPKFPRVEITDHDINYNIASCYRELANIISIDSYSDASIYYWKALEYANKLMNSYNWLKEDIVIDKEVALELDINSDWLPFRILCRNLRKSTDFFKDCKPLVSGKILFVYHSQSIVEEKNSVIRIWIKQVNLEDPEARVYGEYDYSKSLYEFDLKNNKYRVLQFTSYFDNDVLSDDNYPNAEWQYVAPETIAESMIENLKIITK